MSNKIYLVLCSESDGRGGEMKSVCRVFTLYENAYTYCSLRNLQKKSELEYYIEEARLY